MVIIQNNAFTPNALARLGATDIYFPQILLPYKNFCVNSKIMLREIAIENIAVIEKARLSLADGFNVITGETGAGKSLLVGALNIAFGGRVGKDIIREGAQKAVVSVYLDKSSELDWLFERLGLDDDELILTRSINRKGTSRAFVSGVPVAVSLLREIGDSLVEFHSQGSHTHLLKPSFHLAFLDTFAGLSGDAKRFASLYRDFRSLADRIESLHSEIAHESERLRYIRDEFEMLSRAELSDPDEDAIIAKRLDEMESMEEIIDSCAEAVAAIRDNDLSATALVVQSLKKLKGISSSNEMFREAVELLEEVEPRLTEAARLLDKVSSSVELSPHDVEFYRARLSLLKGLTRRFGMELSELIARRDELSTMLSAEGELQMRLDELERERETLIAQMQNLGISLRKSRLNSVSSLERAVEKELSLLGMHSARFIVQVSLSQDDNSPFVIDDVRCSPSLQGFDSVEFLIAPNPGEPPKPLRKIASGGELSRIALALEVVAYPERMPSVIVFDEVDAGIGGITAVRVGERLAHLAKKTQLIVITHLPQIAEQANRHIALTKIIEHKRTQTRFDVVDGKARVRELARMRGEVVNDE